MRIVVLTKPVPDPTVSERLGADGRVDRRWAMYTEASGLGRQPSFLAVAMTNSRVAAGMA